MTGAFTAVYILTLSCFGPACGGLPETQTVVTESPQTCEALAETVRQSNSPLRMIATECRGEAREVSGPAAWSGLADVQP